jgi:hypothetical protein
VSIFYINSYQFATSAGPTDPDFANVSLLLHGDGTNGSTTILDSSSSPKTVTAVGDAQISTAQSKFGGSSIEFDGSGDVLTIPANTAFNFGTGDFTIEAWVYHTGSTNQAIFSCSPCHFVYGIGGKLRFFSASSPSVIDATVSYISNAWAHVAVVRSGTNVTLYQNGVSVGSGTSTRNYGGSSNVSIGAYVGTASFWDGYIDDLRVTKGVARYTSNFTPPTAPFPDA